MSDSYDEGSIMYLLPEYITDIINIISNKRWLIHNFEVTDNELYDPTNYLYHSTLNKTTYTVYLDVNIYQFLINMIKKTEPKKVYREAAAWLVFCQIADIEVDPTLCCYEKLNYQKENIDEVLDDLDIFYSLNNSDPDQLAAFALGVLEHVEIEIEPRKDRNEISKGLLKYNRLIG